MSTVYVDAGALFEDTSELAERAIAVAPGTGYALADLGSEDYLVTVFASPTLCNIAIEGTLHGCRAALRGVPTAGALLASISGHPPVPAGLSVAPAEFDSAIVWLGAAVVDGAGDDELGSLVAAKGATWSSQGERVRCGTGQALALVLVADAVHTMARRSAG